VNLSKTSVEESRAGSTGRRGVMKPGAVCVAFLAAGALIAGCGGSSNTPAPAKTTAPKAATKKAAASNLPAASTTPTTSNVSKSSTASFADASNCKALGGVGTKFAQAMEAATSGGKVNYQAAVKAYQQLAGSAPSAIRPDLEDMAQAFTSFASAISKSGFKPGKVPSPSQIAGLESAAKSFSSAKLEKDEKDVEAWAVKNCS
jgi:hypothetical protein